MFFLHFLVGQTDQIGLRLIWIGVVAAVVGALALAAVMLWRCQSHKKSGYLGSNQAACISFLDSQSKRRFKRYGIIRYLIWRICQCQFIQWDHVSLELFLILAMWEFTALRCFKPWRQSKSWRNHIEFSRHGACGAYTWSWTFRCQASSLRMGCQDIDCRQIQKRPWNDHGNHHECRNGCRNTPRSELFSFVAFMLGRL